MPENPKVGEIFNARAGFRAMNGFSIPLGVATDPDLTSTAKLAYGQLRWRGGPDANCFASIRDIAQSIGVQDARHVRRVLRDLEERRYIRVTPRLGPTGRKTTNKVEFLWHERFEETTPYPGGPQTPYPGGPQTPYPGGPQTPGYGVHRPSSKGVCRPQLEVINIKTNQVTTVNCVPAPSERPDILELAALYPKEANQLAIQYLNQEVDTLAKADRFRAVIAARLSTREWQAGFYKSFDAYLKCGDWSVMPKSTPAAVPSQPQPQPLPSLAERLEARIKARLALSEVDR